MTIGEKDPLEEYASNMKHVRAPSTMARNMLAQIQDEERRARDTGDTTGKAREKRIKPFGNTARRLAAAAACLALLAGAFGIPTMLKNSGTDASHAPLVLRAYAAEGGSAFSESEDNTITFGALSTNMGVPAQPYYEQEGVYVAALFGIDTDAPLAKASVSTDRGELYLYQVETFIKSDNPQLWQDILRAKPRTESSPSLESFDHVQPLYIDDGIPRADENKTVGYAACTRLGSEVELTSLTGEDRSLGDIMLGLWTNDAAAYAAMEQETDSPFNSFIRYFDGASITLKLEYLDGSSSTQSIELHASDETVRLFESSLQGTYSFDTNTTAEGGHILETCILKGSVRSISS